MKKLKLMLLLNRGLQYERQKECYLKTNLEGIKIIPKKHNISFDSKSCQISLSSFLMLIKDSGSGKIKINDFLASIENLPSYFKLSKVDFSIIDIELNKDKSKLSIIKAEGKGSLFNAKAKGIMNIAVPIENSKLDIKVDILPDSPYFTKSENMSILKNIFKNISKGKMKFHIKGTIRNPRASIL